MEEQWLPVPGWETAYSVSNFGRVRRETDNAGKGGPGTIIKGWISVTGYPTVKLTEMPRRQTYQIHRLVMAAFVGPCAANQEVNHKDGIKTNPQLDNLEYVTRKENIHHAIRIGLFVPGAANRGKKRKMPPGFVSISVAFQCARCGAEFIDAPSQKRTYCSKKCQHAKVRATGTCIVCGAQFTGKASRIAVKKYCSNRCAGTKTIENIKHFKPSKQNANCERCGASFEFTPGIHRGRFCSRDCFRNRATPPAR